MRKRTFGFGKPRPKRRDRREIEPSSAVPEPSQGTPEPVSGHHNGLLGRWQFVRKVNGAGFALAHLRPLVRIAASALGGG